MVIYPVGSIHNGENRGRTVSGGGNPETGETVYQAHEADLAIDISVRVFSVLERIEAGLVTQRKPQGGLCAVR